MEWRLPIDSVLFSRALYFNLLGLWIILFCAVFSGLIMYCYFKDCDPWTSGLVSAPDQVCVIVRPLGAAEMSVFLAIDG